MDYISLVEEDYGLDPYSYKRVQHLTEIIHSTMYNFKIFDVSALSAITDLFDILDLGKHVDTYNIKS